MELKIEALNALYQNWRCALTLSFMLALGPVAILQIVCSQKNGCDHIVRMLAIADPEDMAAGAIAEKAKVSPFRNLTAPACFPRNGSRSIIYTASDNALGPSFSACHLQKAWMYDRIQSHGPCTNG